MFLKRQKKQESVGTLQEEKINLTAQLSQLVCFYSSKGLMENFVSTWIHHRYPVISRYLLCSLLLKSTDDIIFSQLALQYLVNILWVKGILKLFSLWVKISLYRCLNPKNHRVCIGYAQGMLSGWAGRVLSQSGCHFLPHHFP